VRATRNQRGENIVFITWEATCVRAPVILKRVARSEKDETESLS